MTLMTTPIAVRAGAAPTGLDCYSDPAAAARSRRANAARSASGRRHQVDPTTSDRDYSADELEFMRAMQDYKRRSGRMFPTWSEALEVLRGLGYAKGEAAAPAPGAGR
jgi:hypothetical protein